MTEGRSYNWGSPHSPKAETPHVFDKDKFHSYYEKVVTEGFTRRGVSDEEAEDIRTTLLAGYAEQIRELTSFSQLIEYFGTHEVEFDNEWHGVGRSEHLIKRLAMAEALSSSLLLPVEMGLREKIHALLGQNDRLESVDEEKYVAYIRSRLDDSLFTRQEIDTVTEKVSPSLFASFDGIAEKSLLILNALPGTTTLNSCAGHQKAVVHNVYFADQCRSAAAFVTFKVSDARTEAILSDRLRSLKVDQGIFQMGGPNVEHVYQLRYRVDAPFEWSEEHPRAIYTASDEATQLRETFFSKLNDILVDCLQAARAPTLS